MFSFSLEKCNLADTFTVLHILQQCIGIFLSSIQLINLSLPSPHTDRERDTYISWSSQSSKGLQDTIMNS